MNSIDERTHYELLLPLEIRSGDQEEDKGVILAQRYSHKGECRQRAVEAGADGFLVSNHGGRKVDSAMSTLGCVASDC